MNKTRFTTKVLLSLLVVMVVLGSIAVVANAADTFKNYKLAYGEIVPTDAKLEAQKLNYSLYGDSDDIYFMRISKGKKNAFFAVEIYSDKNYQTQIRSYSKNYDTTPGNKPLKVTWDFKSIPSGTYYGRCYTFIEVDGKKSIDTASLKTFVINVDRISKKTVELKSIANSASGPKITWTPFPTATKYHVMRRASDEKSWTNIATLGAKSKTYTDKTAKSGKTYSYTVKCAEGKLFSLYNKTGLTIKYLAAPEISVDGTGASGNAKITWKAISGADGYYIYRKGGSLSDYEWVRVANIKNGKTTSYTDKTATSDDWKYTYTAKAYSGKVTSASKSSGVDFDYIPAPKLTKTTITKDGLKIEWKNSNTNVTKYYVYRKNGTSWSRLGTTTGKSFVDKTAASGKTYTYTVKAVSNNNVGAFNSKGITAKFLGAPKIGKITFDSNYKAKVQWEKVPGAAGYTVYRKINNAEKWTLVATIKSGSTTTFTDSCKKTSGYSYRYSVRAFDSKNLLSAAPPSKVGVCLGKPSITSQQIVTSDGSLCIETTWKAIKGATKYNVYRRLPGGSWTTLAKGITETSYQDRTVKCGITYEYSVRSFNDAGDYSAYNVKSAIAVMIPTLNSVTVTKNGAVLAWDALENADSYTIYRRAKDSKTWESIGTSKTNKYTDKTAESKSKLFYYTISATFDGTESQYRDGLPNFFEFKATAKYVAATKKAAAHIYVDFKCPGATKIEVYKTVNDEKPVLLGAVSGSFKDTGIEEGNTYTYKIVVTGDGKVSNSTTASARVPYPPLAAAVISQVKSNYNDNQPYAEITWGAVKFANKYIVLRKYTNDKKWTEIATVTTKKGVTSYTYTDTDILADVYYQYAIKAVSNNSERGTSTSKSAEVYITAPLGSVTGLKIETPEKTEDGKIMVRVSWDPTEFASSYKLSRKTADGDFELLHVSGTVLEYIDTIEANTEYTYRVEASAPGRDTVSNEETFIYIDETVKPDVPNEPENPEDIPDGPTVNPDPDKPVDPDEPGVVEPDEPDVPTVTPDPEEPIDPETPEEPVQYITIVNGAFYFDGSDIIVTNFLKCENIADIVVATEGFTLEATKEKAYYGTGTEIKVLKDGEIVKTYYLVVKSDVNGDGVCDVLDLQDVEKFNGGVIGFDDFSSIAGDLNNDDSINYIDEELFLEHI